MTWKSCLHYWPFVRGIHQSNVDSPHNGLVTSVFDVSVVVSTKKMLIGQWIWWCFVRKRIGVIVCKNRQLLTLSEDLYLPRKPYNCSGKLKLLLKTYNCSGALTNCPGRLSKLLRNTFVTALGHFRNCSVVLTIYSVALTNCSVALINSFGRLISVPGFL